MPGYNQSNKTTVAVMDAVYSSIHRDRGFAQKSKQKSKKLLFHPVNRVLLKNSCHDLPQLVK